MTTPRIIGIDLGDVAAHVAAIYDPAAHTWITRSMRFHTRPAAVQALLDKARQGQAEVEVVAVMEATGMSWWPLSTLLHQAGVRLYRLNGVQVKEFKKSLRRSGFSDRTDAQALALMYAHIAERIEPFVPPSPEQIGLQMACRHYAHLRDLSVATLNRLLARDRAIWGGQGLHGLVPKVAWPWLRTSWYDPLLVAATRRETLIEAWQAYGQKAGLRPRQLAADWIPAWHARAQERKAIFAAYPGLSLVAATVTQEQRLYDHLQAEQDTWRRYIVDLHASLYPDDVLLSLPGVGALSAAIYRAFVGDIHRFPNAAAFRAWTGLVPRSHASGTYRSQGQRITKAGPNLIKETLYLNAGAARLWDVQLGALYYTMRVERNHPHAKAQIVVATRLAGRLYSVWKRNTSYVLRDLNGHPITRSEARDLIRTHYAIPEEVRRRQRRHHA